jgi:hypothetical protein
MRKKAGKEFMTGLALFDFDSLTPALSSFGEERECF